MASSAARNDLTGMTISEGKYRLLALLGEGGGGQVYAGEQTAIGKRVAIKILAMEYAKQEKLVRQFLREARAATRIEHENIVQIFDFGSTGTGTAYIAMENLVGETLADLIEREGRIGWHRTKTIALQICRALHVAHSNGVVHRDMKPENCFRIKRRANEDFVKILDFGLAKVFGDERQPQLALSTTGTIFGTPEYMSPEQARGETADDRSDVYAVGIMLFEMLTGRVPFSDRESYLATLVMHTSDPPPKPSSVAPDAGIPAQVDALVLKALAKDSVDRFQSMRELAEAILAVPTAATPTTSTGAVATVGRWIDQPNAKLVVVFAATSVLLAVGLVLALV